MENTERTTETTETTARTTEATKTTARTTETTARTTETTETTTETMTEVKETKKETESETTTESVVEVTKDINSVDADNSELTVEEKTEECKGTNKEEAVKEEAAKEEAVKEEADEDTVGRPKKKRGKLILGILLVTAFLIAVVGYFAVAYYYQNHFFSNTYIDNLDCSNMESTAVMARLEENTKGYALEVYGRNPQNPDENVLLGTLEGSSISYADCDNKSAVDSSLQSQNPYLWFTMLFGQEKRYEIVKEVTFDESRLELIVSSWDAFRSANMQSPRDAYIQGYSEEEQRYLIVPEKNGSLLDVNEVIAIVKEAVCSQNTTVNLEDYGCYKNPYVTADDKKLLDTVNTLNRWLTAEITYDWNGTEVILDRSTIKNWISYQDGKGVLDEEAVEAFVKENARKLDTYGRNKRFTTSLGVDMVLPSAYGWQVNRKEETAELIKLVREGYVGKREPIYSITAWNKGENDIGSSFVEIDLSNQHLYLYIKGELKLETDFVSGNMSNGNFTPPGVFGLTYKTKNATLRGRDYETPVNYWMPFNGNVGMHDATWRGSFGGNIFLTGGSHGCVNLPLSKAAEIYDYIDEGFPVICYYYQPVEEIVAQLAGQPANIPNESAPAPSEEYEEEEDDDEEEEE